MCRFKEINMRIVKYDEFLTFPNGTVYAEYNPSCFDEIRVKHDNINGRDFIFTPAVPTLMGTTNDMEYFAKLDEMQKTGVDVPFDFDCATRNAEYDKNQFYAVYSDDDVKNLCALLLGQDFDQTA